LLGAGVEPLHVIRNDERGVGARGGAQQVAAAAARFAPQIDDTLVERAAGELAHARQSLGVRTRNEIVECGLGRLRDPEG